MYSIFENPRASISFLTDLCCFFVIRVHSVQSLENHLPLKECNYKEKEEDN